MEILITNDDSVNASQLLPFIRWAQKLGSVTAVVPLQEQSGKSMSITFTHPIAVGKQQLAADVEVITLDSSPADCVRYAVLGLGKKFDLVFSGVNHGLNVGSDIFYSGTAAGIFEAATHGIPAVAFSCVYDYYEVGLKHLDELWDYFRRHRLLEKHPLYNVNIARDPLGIRITRQGRTLFQDTFPPLGNGTVGTSYHNTYVDTGTLDTDMDAIHHNYHSITPLTLERTDLSVYQTLKELN